MENRVILNRKVVGRHEWNHVRGIDDLADIPARYYSNNDLRRWFDCLEILCDLEFSFDKDCY